MCALILLTPLRVKAILGIVLSWSWLGKKCFSSSFIDDTTLSLTLEYFFGSLTVLLNGVEVVLPHARCLLLEVDVDGDWLHIIEGVVLIEG